MFTSESEIAELNQNSLSLVNTADTDSETTEQYLLFSFLVGDIGLVGVTEGRVPIASRSHSYNKPATTRRSGRVTGVWAGTKRGEEGEGSPKRDVEHNKFFFLRDNLPTIF